MSGKACITLPEAVSREQQKVIQIKDDAPRFPTSVAPDVLHATLFGPLSAQPSRDTTPRKKGLSLGGALILFMLFGPALIGMASCLGSSLR